MYRKKSIFPEVNSEQRPILVDKEKDLFAMMRQIGKPTMFMTLSASEIHWLNLLKLLNKLGDYRKDIILTDPMAQLDRSARAKTRGPSDLLHLFQQNG